MNLYVGTSGYAYKERKGSFSPADLPAKRMLHFYGEHFRTVEINNIRSQRFAQCPAEESSCAGHRHDRLCWARMFPAAAWGIPFLFSRSPAQ